jgi:hypothetical protein
MRIFVSNMFVEFMADTGEQPNDVAVVCFVGFRHLLD